jgi:signal transduction histidine kinase
MDDDAGLTFPNEPRVQLDRVLENLVSRVRDVSSSQANATIELDRVMGELLDRARDVTATQGRLRALLRANLAVVQQLDLPTVLQQIVDAAAELLGAQYAALGVIAPHGGLEEFVHFGMSPHDVEAIGHLPEGHGLLGAVIDDPRPIRLAHLSQDPRSTGFPRQHPPMDALLSVPVRVRDEVYGNLYLSNSSNGEFTAEDEELAIALAGTAGFAIDNARLYAETRARQAWSDASAELTAGLLSEEQEDSLSVLAARAQALASADFAWVLRPSASTDELVVSVAEGIDGLLSEGDRIRRRDSVAASVLEARQPLNLVENDERARMLPNARALGPMMLVPMAASRDLGVLIVGRLSKQPPFTRAEIEMLADFASHASVAMELAEARAERQRGLLLEDRARIARDLHDHVIQHLFATGLRLQSFALTVPDGTDTTRLDQSIDSIDAAIAQIRTAIFAISGTSGDTVRNRVLDIVNELGGQFARTPQVGFSGPVDLVIVGDLADDVVAVVRESLTNAAKHASAANVSVHIAADNDVIAIEIVDDGRGFSDSTHRGGLENLRARAVRYGGLFAARSGDGTTRVQWSVPYADAPGIPR